MPEAAAIRAYLLSRGIPDSAILTEEQSASTLENIAFSRKLMEEAITCATPGQEEHRGLGFHLAGTPDSFFSTEVPSRCFGHTGFTGTSLLVEPESGLWVLLLSNRVYPTRDSLVAFLLAHMPNPDGSSEEARRKLYDSQLSQLKHWR